MEIFEGLKKDVAADSTHASPVDFLMVVGDGRDDEVIFRWANELQKNETVKNVTTVSLGSRNTEAGFTLTNGVTGTSLLCSITDRVLTSFRRSHCSPETVTTGMKPLVIEITNIKRF